MVWPGWLKRVAPGKDRKQLVLTVAGMTAVFWGVFLFAPDLSAPSEENWSRLVSYVSATWQAGQDGISAPASHEGGSATFSLCYSGGGTNCVVDGDTFWFQGQKIRMADIDAPETHPSRCAHEADLGQRATLRLQDLLNEGPIILEPIGRDMDVYGRKLRIVARDGQSLGEILVSEGLARSWTGSRRPWCGPG